MGKYYSKGINWGKYCRGRDRSNIYYGFVDILVCLVFMGKGKLGRVG